VLLDFIDNGGVLEDLSVVGKVDGRGLFRQDLQAAAGVVMTLFEVRKR